MNPPPAGLFPSTQWSDFAALRAGGAEAGEALERICRDYWLPLYAYARQRADSTSDGAEEAADLTQGFFERLIARDTLGNLSAEGGKFRSFLLTAFKNFMVDRWKHAQRQARRPAGGWTPLEREDLERIWVAERVPGDSPDRAYDRRCALALLGDTFVQVEADYAQRGRLELCQRLQAFLHDDPDAASHAETATALGLTESAVKSELHRLRQRFREILHQRVALTVSNPAQVEEELAHLLAALG